MASEEAPVVPRLLYHPLSQPCRSVLWCMDYLGKEVEKVYVDVEKGENKTPEYLAKHPFGQVPVLEEEDFNLAESSAILEYITVGTRMCLPVDAMEAAKVSEYFGRHHSIIRNLSIVCFVPILIADPIRRESVIRSTSAEVAPILQRFNSVLAGQQFIGGEELSMADFLFTCEVDQLHVFGILRPYKHICSYLSRIHKVKGHLACWTGLLDALKLMQVISEDPPPFSNEIVSTPLNPAPIERAAANKKPANSEAGAKDDCKEAPAEDKAEAPSANDKLPTPPSEDPPKPPGDVSGQSETGKDACV